MLDLIVIQFAKFPKKGRVKTRLEPLLGQDGSYQLHIKMVDHLIQVCQIDNAQHVLALDTFTEHTKLDEWKQLTHLILQQGEDLGEKMQHALSWGLSQAKHAMVIGSDCPAINQDVIHTIHQQLQNHDVAFVPAEDGGYVLIGASQLSCDVFSDMPWGTDQVMEKTQQRLDANNTSYFLHPMLWDVDRPEDYQRLVEWMPGFKVD